MLENIQKYVTTKVKQDIVKFLNGIQNCVNADRRKIKENKRH